TVGGGQVTVRALDQGEILQRAVDLVRAGEDDGLPSSGAAHGFQKVQRAAGVDLKILDRLVQARGDGSLGAEVKHRTGVAYGCREVRLLPQVGDAAMDTAAVPLLEPAEVLLDAA